MLKNHISAAKIVIFPETTNKKGIKKPQTLMSAVHFINT